jgi:hypothetical protein
MVRVRVESALANPPITALGGDAYAVERAADPLHRARIDTKSLCYLGHAFGAARR